MGRKWLLSLVCLSLLVVWFTPLSSARFDLRIDEGTTTISFEQLAPTLAVENGSGNAMAATVRLELLTPSDKAVGTIEQTLTIAKRQTEGSGQTVEVLVNDQRIDSLRLPSDKRYSAPLTTDLSAAAKTGKNRIEIRRLGNGPIASVQVVSTYWVPWSHSTNSVARTEHSQTMTLETTFNKTQAGVMEDKVSRQGGTNWISWVWDVACRNWFTSGRGS